jgi:hypothetical protein
MLLAISFNCEYVSGKNDADPDPQYRYWDFAHRKWVLMLFFMFPSYDKVLL